VGYEYPHSLPEGVSEQSLMPEGMEDRRYYEPTKRGFEAELRERLVSFQRKQRKSGN
jgi:putative ATPase